MKKILYIALITMISALGVSAQSNGLYMTSSLKTQTGVLYHSSAATPMQAFTSTTNYRSVGATCMETVVPCSRYSSNVTAVGAINIKGETQQPATVGRRRVDGYPQIPFPDPVGEVPWVMMGLLAGLYATRRRKSHL